MLFIVRCAFFGNHLSYGDEEENNTENAMQMTDGSSSTVAVFKYCSFAGETIFNCALEGMERDS